MEYSATCGVYSRKTRFGRGRVEASYQISQDVGQIEERDGQARVTLEKLGLTVSTESYGYSEVGAWMQQEQRGTWLMFGDGGTARKEPAERDLLYIASHLDATILTLY